MSRSSNLDRFYAIMALDDVREVYPHVGIVDSADRVHDIFKDCVRQAHFSGLPERRYPVFAAFNEALIEPGLRQFLTQWSNDLYFHISSFADRSLGEWKTIFIQTKYQKHNFITLKEEREQLALHFFDSVEAVERQDGYFETVKEIKARFDLSEWDIKLHTFYKFNYFGGFGDLGGPNDPFLYTKGVHWGRIFLNAIRTSPVIRDPQFPTAELMDAMRKFKRDNGIEDPSGYQLATLQDLAGLGPRRHRGVEE